MVSDTNRIPPALVDVLRSTLRHLEAAEGLQADDPALVEMKSHIVRAIAELELMRTPKAA